MKTLPKAGFFVVWILPLRTLRKTSVPLCGKILNHKGHREVTKRTEICILMSLTGASMTGRPKRKGYS